jgi:hypothetical protein
MTIQIIVKEDIGDQVEMTLDPSCYADSEWEEVCYQIGCAVARELANDWLDIMDESLKQSRPKSMKVEKFCKRTLVSRFGEVTVWRRLYRDDKGKYHFLLDEYLNWRPKQEATPSLTAALVDSATKLSFRKASMEAEKYSAGVLSSTTVHRLVQKVSQDAMRTERAEWCDCFKDGSLPPPGRRKVPVLYTEADGVYVHLQREGQQKHCELKSAIAYEGWERLPQKQERYRLVNKKVYCHVNCRGDESGDGEGLNIPFWDGAGIEWHKHWDLGYTKLVVLGGDAQWIDKGVAELGFCIRQLSGFHLARSCRCGWKEGKAIYDTIRSGAIWVGEAHERSGKTAQKARDYVLKRLKKGVDWRKKAESGGLEIPGGARGLGAIEGNEGNLFADRMKDRGMSWTIPGAHHMGKAIQLAYNGDLKHWSGGKPPGAEVRRAGHSFALFQELDNDGVRGMLPALGGPHASRPWVGVLRNMVDPIYRVN